MLLTLCQLIRKEYLLHDKGYATFQNFLLEEAHKKNYRKWEALASRSYGSLFHYRLLKFSSTGRVSLIYP
jgi:hypothetical protein